MRKRQETAQRYTLVSAEKSSGATYTPDELADFVATEMVACWRVPETGPFRILDPAMGDGALLAALLNRLPQNRSVEVHGFDSNERTVQAATERLQSCNPNVTFTLTHGDFLKLVADFGDSLQTGLFDCPPIGKFDLVIANPPYVRTQVLGADISRALAARFDLSGRVDLYHAFLLGIAKVVRGEGVAGIIVSNRFMTTKAGATVRRALRENLRLQHVWDLGDTKIFDAAVLPAVLIAKGLNGSANGPPSFTSIYETGDEANKTASCITAALRDDGVIAVPDGRSFRVQRGSLHTSEDPGGVWRVTNAETTAWLQTVTQLSWGSFRDLGKVRVGVKTCADRIFIGHEWDLMPPEDQPELLRPLTTHHVGRRYRANRKDDGRHIIYPHESVDGKRRAVNLEEFPKTLRYLEAHRAQLEARSYVIEAGRNWFELWVPQDPGAWSHPKLVFRDISEKPCFWIDRDGTVVNGDCYWLVCDDPTKEELLWLAVSVGNSTFIETFYDRRFNNKLYAGRRRFITQYVEQFPLPDPGSALGQAIIAKAKELYESVGTAQSRIDLETEINALVWRAFGLSVEEVDR